MSNIRIGRNVVLAKTNLTQNNHLGRGGGPVYLEALNLLPASNRSVALVSQLFFKAIEVKKY